MLVDSLRLTISCVASRCFFFFFNDTATTEIYTLSLHDALPICHRGPACASGQRRTAISPPGAAGRPRRIPLRSEEHTSELQSQSNLVCRLLLEKKKSQDHMWPDTFIRQSAQNASIL